MKRLLYLHGVGDDGKRLDWFDSLNLGRGELVAPDYLDLLNAEPASFEGPRDSFPTKSDATDTSRRNYRSSQVQLHEELGRFGSCSILPERRSRLSRVPGFIDAIAEQLVVRLAFEAVSRYNNDEARRRAVRQRVAEALPDGGCELVVVGHSLGALVALDLVAHLPDNVHIQLLVTAASALARRKVRQETLQLRHRFPYDRVGVWLNVYNTSDAVTRGSPIGPRFPQVIDVSVSGSFGDHALATCIADPGVAHVIRSAVADGAEKAIPTESMPTGELLPRTQTLHLALAQLTMRMEELLATLATTTPADLVKFHEARRLVHEGPATVAELNQPWDSDHADILRKRTAEEDVSTVLMQLTVANPLESLTVRIPAAIEMQARLQAAKDIGLPPSWIALAEECLAQIEVALPLLHDDRTESDADHVDDEKRDVAEINIIRDSLRRTLSNLTLTAPHASTVGQLADLRPAVAELLARALVSHRLGARMAGTEEREALSRLMAELGHHRARVGRWSTTPLHFAGQLQESVTAVAQGLDWLASQGIGIQPRKPSAELEFV
jgi:pimeloyl-ACP methyl ester carboxylesterase